MMKEIKVFKNEEFGKIRTLEENGKILFCGSDVAKALGYARPNDAMSAHCRATVKRSTPISGKMQKINFIPEGDVYRLITHSKLPAAEKFESWVFDRIKPIIEDTPANKELSATTNIDSVSKELAQDNVSENENNSAETQNNNEIIIFNNQEFGSLRTIEINGEPWFVGKDVAEVLGYTRPDHAITKHVDIEDKLMYQIDTSGQNRKMYIINESGLYSLILSSKLPKAKQFKHWVTSEIKKYKKNKSANSDRLSETVVNNGNPSEITQNADGIMLFNNQEFGSLRTVEINGEPWFVGKDVAEMLGYSKARNAISSHVYDEDKKDAPIWGTLGGTQTMTIINESGLYSLILSSKLPKAKQFKHWVTSEVLPTIRKHGLYAKDDILNNPDVWITVLQGLKAEREKNKQLSDKIEADKPKVEFAEHVASDPYGILIREFAKLCCDNGIEIGEKRLFKFLREKGYLNDKNIPYQQFIDRGYFKLKETYISSIQQIKFVPRITGKGQQYLFKKLKEQLCYVS